MPLGVDVGPAGLSVAKFSFVFQGSFYRMADLLHNIRSLVQRRNRQFVVSGRLVTVGGIALVRGRRGVPAGQGDDRGDGVPPASRARACSRERPSQGPANATAATPSPGRGPASPSTPPAAVVSPR